MKRLSVSQPLLDDSDSFDIPSPPPLAENRFDSSFLLLNQLHAAASVGGRAAAEEEEEEVADEPRRAPIATIPELQLDYVDSSEDKENVPVGRDAPTTHLTAAEVETFPDLDEPSRPVTPAIQPVLAVNHTSGQRVGDSDQVSAGGEPCDIPQPPCTNTDTSLTALSHDRPDEPDDSEIPPVSAPPHQADILSRDTDSPSDPETNLQTPANSIPEPTESVSATRGAKPLRPVDQDKVYGDLCESLLPQSFTSEVLSSFSHHPASKLYFETRQLGAKGEPVAVRTLDESQLERNFVYSRLSSSAVGKVEDGGSGYSPAVTSSDSEPERDSVFTYRYPSSSLYSRSEPADGRDALRLSAVKSDGFSISSSPEVQLSTPPIPDYATSRGTRTQVTGSSRRAILVKELVTDEASSHACSPSPVPEEASMERKSFNSFNVDLTDAVAAAADGLASPTYLSVGSDDSSAMEVYYSAEEDNGVYSGDEDAYSAAESEETCVGEGTGAGLQELHFPEEEEGEWRSKIAQEVVLEGKDDYRSPVETPGRAGNQEAAASDSSLAADCAKSGEKDDPTVAIPRVRGEGQEGTKAELLAAPVGQVSGAMVCELPPPSGEPQQREERNWVTELATEDHPNGEQRPADQERIHLGHRGTCRSHYTDLAAGEDGVITGKPTEAEEEVLISKGGDESRESRESEAAAPLAQSSEPQATAESQDNRALQSSGEWAGPITQADRTGAARRQVTVEPSAAQTRRPGDQLQAGGRIDTAEG